jgi:hypothetical protein
MPSKETRSFQYFHHVSMEPSSGLFGRIDIHLNVENTANIALVFEGSALYWKT